MEKDLVKQMWNHASVRARLSSYEGGVTIDLSNPGKIRLENPALLKRLKEVDKKFNLLYTKTKEIDHDKLWKKYSNAIHGVEFESDKTGEGNERMKEILNLIFNILYAEALQIEKDAFINLDKVEKEMDEELKKL